MTNCRSLEKLLRMRTDRKALRGGRSLFPKHSTWAWKLINGGNIGTKKPDNGAAET